MSAAQVILQRRERISKCLAKSITSPVMIATQLNSPDKDGKEPDEADLIKAKTISNDLSWMKKNSVKWLSGWALNGYIFETQQTIDQLKDIELELQKLRSESKSVDVTLKIVKELTEVINMRWVMQGDGPTLMHNKYISTLTK